MECCYSCPTSYPVITPTCPREALFDASEDDSIISLYGTLSVEFLCHTSAVYAQYVVAPKDEISGIKEPFAVCMTHRRNEEERQKCQSTQECYL